MIRSVVLLSGGMDSTVLLAKTIHDRADPIAVSFDYGQRHGRAELAAASAVARHYAVEHTIVDLHGLAALLPGSALTDPAVEVPDGHYAAPTMAATVVPNRNLIMLAVAGGIADATGAERVLTAVHAEDHPIYPDCRPEFITAANLAFAVALGGRVRIQAPFAHITKTDIARLGGELNAPLHLSWSCYKGGERHCGRCGTCCERSESLRDAHLADPTEYADPLFAERVLAGEPTE